MGRSINCQPLSYAPVTIVVPGTCGELIQGWYEPWNQAVLVSCPVARYSWVTVQLQTNPEINAPAGFVKACRAARLLLDALGWPDLGATIQINSQLQIGRGMASSTADIIGVMAGLAIALGHNCPPEMLARLACQIEPSDSIMFSELALLSYRNDGATRCLGPVPPLSLIMLDPGHMIDTLVFNAGLDILAIRNLASDTQTAIDLLCRGLLSNDARLIGAAATMSAISYQAICHNPLVEFAQHWTKITGALGIVRAHSGTIVGLLYPPNTRLSEPAHQIASCFQGELTITHLTKAGFRQVRPIVQP